MKKQKITIEVVADNILEAESIRQGIQAIVNETGGQYNDFIIELASPGVAASYKNKIASLLDNPIIKRLASGF